MVPSLSRRANQARASAPIALQCADRYPDNTGRFLNAQAGVKAELDDLRELCVFRLEPLDRLVQRKQIARRRLDPSQTLGQLAAVDLPSSLETPLVRACSIKISRIARAAAPKKWRRPSQPGSWSRTNLRYASWTRAVGWRV